MNLNKKVIFYVVNVDWFFISHRLALAKEGIKRGHDVYLVTKDTGKFQELKPLGIKTIDIPFSRVKSNYFNDLIAFFKLCFIYNRYKPDVIHHISLKPIIFGTLANVFFSRRSKLVNAVSGLGYAFTGSERPYIKSIILLLLKFVFSLNRNNVKFIFQNNSDLEIFNKYLLINCSQSFIIRGSGVDEKIFKSEKKIISDNKPIQITLLARMLKDKGVFDFIRAAQLIQTKLKGKVLFRLVGGLDPDNPAAIKEKELRDLLIKDYLIWEGARSDIIDVYKETDIACLPSYREGLPKSLIEAMAMQCAILTTDVPGCRDCVEDGVNGCLVAPHSPEALADKILFMINDVSLLAKMGLESRKKMLIDMTLSSVVHQTYILYED